MTAHNLQALIDAAAGARLDLDPSDHFVLDHPAVKLRGQVDLHLNGSLVEHTARPKVKTAPMFSGPYVSGIIEGVGVHGTKDPADGYVVRREGHAGFWFVAPSDLTLRDVTVEHVCGDFIYLTAKQVGTKKAGTFRRDLARRIVLDNVRGLDAGRHAVCAIGVGYAYEGSTIPGLTIRANCSFRGWKRAKIDRERWAGYVCPADAIDDQGATWERRA